jgi:hypothetical protein
MGTFNPITENRPGGFVVPEIALSIAMPTGVTLLVGMAEAVT